MQNSQKQRQQQSLRQKSLLATRGVVLQQPIGEFGILLDRFAAENSFAEKKACPTSDGEGWSGDMDAFASSEQPSPEDYLVDQLLEQRNLKESEIELCRYIISDLDESGFFSKPIAAYATQLKTSAANIRAILRMLQSLEPAGLGAHDAPHAFALQMARVFPDLPVSECARWLRTRQHSISPGVIRACLRKFNISCTPAEWQQVEHLLDPAPLRHITPSDPRIITPDIIIERDTLTNGLTCRVSEPPWRLEIDSAVFASLQSDPATKERITRELSRVSWINEAIANRTTVLKKLGDSLIESLGPFLSGQADEPSRIAVEQLTEQTGISRTAMVRALQRKYVKTPRGTFRLHALVMDRWQSKSASAREAIVKLLHQEQGAPLSDQGIVDQLARKGIHISRRAVTKYRLALGIPAHYFRNS